MVIPSFAASKTVNYQAVINTPYPLIFDGKIFYLNAAQGAWYRADSATGPYRFDADPPADLVAMVEASAKVSERPASSEKVTAANAPEIVVATTPSELIVTEGPAEFVPLADDLLVLDNSADDVFMHISTQQYYLVLAGRWYHSPSLNGPWTYRAANALPVAFTQIPDNSEQADSRVYVPGTDEAEQAVLDAQIPVTATVARGPVDLDVSYDGEPSFEPVQGTSLQYADNTASTVIESDRTYYLVEDGVWYVSSSPNGPWEVSDYRPEEVAAIAPESPVYNVKYVYVYDSTPEYVYVGYTPGYTGSYVYGNSIVYGTGYYYDPWISPGYYYPRYSTWGFNVGYNPWTGWGFGLSWGWGPFYAGFYSGGYWHQDQYWGGGGYGYWGPCGYRPRWGYDNDYGYGGGHGHDNWGNDGHHGGHNGGGWNGNDNGDWGNGGNDGGGHGGGNWGGRGQGDLAAGDSRNANLRVRDANLYRDRDQKARVAGIGDRVSGRVTDRPGDLARGTRGASRDLARNSANPAGRGGNLSSRGQANTASVKGGLSRTDPPVKVADLRAKAQKRDAMLGADRGKLFADNNRAGGRSSLAPLERSAPKMRRGRLQKVQWGAQTARQRMPVVLRTPGPGGNATQVALQIAA